MKRPSRYSEHQQSIATLHALRLLTREWFGNKFEPDERRSMAALLFGLYVSSRQGRLATKQQVTSWMGVEHPQTARRYIEKARKAGLVRIAKSKIDKRKSLVVPTDTLFDMVEQEAAAVADDLRWATDALLVDDLPETGAPIVEGSLEGYTLFPGFEKRRGPDERNGYLEELDLDTEGNEDGYSMLLSILAQPVQERPEIEAATEAELSETLELAPNNFMARYKRASLNSFPGREKRAIADLTVAIRLRPAESRLYRERGSHYATLGSYDRAIHDFSEAIRLNPSDSSTFWDRAKVLSKIGNRDAAIADYRSVLSLFALQLHSDVLDYEIEAVLHELRELGVDPESVGVASTDEEGADEHNLDEASLKAWNERYWVDVEERNKKYQEALKTIQKLEADAADRNRTRRLAQLRPTPR